LWNYLVDTYSTKKTKDLVNTQIHKYKQIIQELQEKRVIRESNPENQVSMDALLTDYMENELV
jgi:hypothetical protein